MSIIDRWRERWDIKKEKKRIFTYGNEHYRAGGYSI